MITTQNNSVLKQRLVYSLLGIVLLLAIYYSLSFDIINRNIPTILTKLASGNNSNSYEIKIEKPASDVDYDFFDFEGFDNNDENANHTRIIVPNIVHLVYLGGKEIAFYQMINIFSIFLNQRPDKIYIHCDNCTFTGRYWNEILSVGELRDMIVLKQVAYHNTIYGIQAGVHHMYFIF